MGKGWFQKSDMSRNGIAKVNNVDEGLRAWDMESLGTCQCPDLGSRWKLGSRPGSTNQVSAAALGVDIRKTENTVVRQEGHLQVQFERAERQERNKERE